jgi:hypothetical protein
MVVISTDSTNSYENRSATYGRGFLTIGRRNASPQGRLRRILLV